MRVILQMRTALALVVLSVAAPDVFSGTFKERMEADYECQQAYRQLSSDALRVIESAAQFQASRGRMPSYPEFLELLAIPNQHLSAEDRLGIFRIFGRVQQPTVSATDLYELLRAERESLKTLRTQYLVSYLTEPLTPGGRQPAGEYQRKCTFLFDGLKTLLETSEYRGGTFERKLVEAYDGKALRSSLERPGAMRYGAIQAPDGRGRFFAEGNPLLSAKLLDESVDLQRPGTFPDAARLAKRSFVYETPVQVGATKCIVIGNERVQVFCSLEHGFAVVEERMGRIDIDPSTGGYLYSKDFSVLTNSDFEDIGGKLWLPRRSEFVWTQAGRVVERYVTTVDSYEANLPVPDSTFTDIIPKGAYVADAVQNVCYIDGQGDLDSEFDKISFGPSTSRNRMLWLLAANLIAVLVIGLLVHAQRRRFGRQASDGRTDA
jgi:hypothetical protein